MAGVVESSLSGHVIVCGLGRIGSQLVELLHRLGERVVIVTAAAREDRARRARDVGATLIIGDVRNPANLDAARIATAKAIIAATSEDAVNIETALDARRSRGDLPIVLRLFDRDLCGLIEERVGARRALGSSALATPVLAYAALGEELLTSFSVDDRAYVIGRVRVDERSPLRGLTPGDIHRRHNATVLDVTDDAPVTAGRLTLLAERSGYNHLCGILTSPGPPYRSRWVRPAWRTVREAWTNAPAGLRTIFRILLALIALSVLVFSFAQPLGLADALYYVITTVTTTGYGDITPKDAGLALKLFACFVMLMGSLTLAVLYSFATDFVVNERFRTLMGQPRIPEEGHVIVIGIGNIGYRVTEELLAAGRRVVAIDVKVEGELASTLRPRCPVIAGDGRMATTLEAAHVSRACAVVAATGDDAANLAVGLHARRAAPKARIIARLFDAELAHKVETGGLVDVALSPALVAAPSFVAAALYEGAQAAVVYEGGMLVVQRRNVPEDWVGLTAAEVRIACGIQVLLREQAAGGEGRDDRLRARERVLCAIRRPVAAG